MIATHSGESGTRSIPDRDELLLRSGRWSEKLLDGPITYFPIRHHSPGCALHLTRWIETVRPDAIVIEGPRSMDKWIPMLAGESCVGPVAILSTYREGESHSSPRHSAFYPLCDYSPEWVAARKGAQFGAKIRFADMEFADKLRFQQQLMRDQAEASEGDDQEPAETPKSWVGVLLADESNLRYSDFIGELVRRMGCRDFDELWDHLFESRAESMSTESFVGLMATYCDLSRLSHSDDYLRNDATLAREAVMVETIRSEYKRLKRPKRKGAVLVVTGGFHTVALADAVAAKGNPHLAKLDALDPGRTGNWLIRYSYDQLDALAGYRSGMPSPGFYDALWQADQIPDGDRRGAVARLISTIARDTRGRPIAHEASVTDSIEAVQMLDRLADLRGHVAPTRSDLLDAIYGCMRKESAAGNDLLQSIVQRTLAGDRIGSVPSEAGQPPIVHDFQQSASRFRLPIGTIQPRGVHLELYRKPDHRLISFLFHQLQLLEVPYATFADGPDFVNAYRLGKLSEEWNAGWNPGAEARLAELASLGDTVAAAAAARVMELVRELGEQGQARDADSAVDLLIRSCRAGLHRHSEEIVEVVREHLSEDASFASVARALSRLALLYSARETLEASRLAGIVELIDLAYKRSVFLVDSLAAVPDDQLEASLDGLISMRELIVSGAIESDERPQELRLDESLFFDALDRLVKPTGTPARSEIAGCAAGLLYGRGHIDEQTVCDIACRYLDAAVEDVSDACGVVRGMMMSAREAFWQMDALLRRIDDLFQGWQESRFNNALPHMRLAFSQLAPKEIDAVAEKVATLHDVDEIGPLIHPDITEDDLHVAVRCTAWMKRSLEEDGLT